MNGITFVIKAITPPDTLEHKNRKDEILELQDYLYVETDAGENFSVVYVGASEPGVNDKDKVWLKTTNSDNMPSGIYHYGSNGWSLKTNKAVLVSSTPPEDAYDGLIWISTAESGTYLKGIYYYDEGWEKIASFTDVIIADTNPSYNCLWVNTNRETSGVNSARLLLPSEGSDPSVSSNWKNAMIDPKVVGVYLSSNVPLQSELEGAYTSPEGWFVPPLWSNLGMGGDYYENIYKLSGDYWISLMPITLVKQYDNISVPSGVPGNGTLYYKEDHTDYFYETPILLTQLYSDTSTSALRWAVRPKCEELKAFEYSYYSAEDRTISIVLVAIGKIRIPKRTS